MISVRQSGWILIAFLSLGVAGYGLIAYSFYPLGAVVHPDMRANYNLHPVGIYAHVFGAMFALALGPFQFSDRLRRAGPALHRWCGRLYLSVGVSIGGVAGLYMSFYAYGGMVSQTGFALLALLWLYTGFHAWRAIRSRDVAAHRRWMIRNFALTFAAVTLRLWLPPAVSAGVPFELAYPAIAWLCWVPNLVAAEYLVKRQTGIR